MAITVGQVTLNNCNIYGNEASYVSLPDISSIARWKKLAGGALPAFVPNERFDTNHFVAGFL